MFNFFQKVQHVYNLSLYFFLSLVFRVAGFDFLILISLYDFLDPGVDLLVFSF